MKSLAFAAFAAAMAFALPAHAAPITVLAAENFYGEAAQAIGATASRSRPSSSRRTPIRTNSTRRLRSRARLRMPGSW